MKRLNRQNRETYTHPIKIMQFGEGNFLRAFVDWQIDQLNKHNNLNAGVAIVRPIDFDGLPLLNTQDGLYTTIVRGINERGEAVEQVSVIECVNEEVPVYKDFKRFLALAELTSLELIFSNTTEAGIEFIDSDKLSDSPAKAFPAKLTQWLYHRYKHFNGSEDAGLTIIPCELIDYNGDKLKQVVMQYCQLWKLEQGFVNWLNQANHFCSTLVDRIVTGFPRDEHAELEEKFGYLDNFMVTSEYFHLFVIQGPDSLKQTLHLEGSDLNILVVDDIYPYKQRKVAILNGAHTALVPLAYLGGLDSVGEAMSDELYSSYIEALIFKEIIPTLDLPEASLQQFAHDVIKRFRNPFVHHLLMSISLNSMTKFKTRVVPQLSKYLETNKEIPVLMAAAIAGQILLYKGVRNGELIPLSDSPEWLTEFKSVWQFYQDKSLSLEQLVGRILSAKWHWEQDLAALPGLTDTVTCILRGFLRDGVRETLSGLLQKELV